MKTYICGFCNKECKWSYQSNNKYCSVKCASQSKAKQHREDFWDGKLTRIDRPTARTYIAEVRGYKCEIPECGVTEWLGKPLTLHVDHTNGDSSNDHPTNLRLLCPNCHYQTEFLGAANKGRGRKSLGLPLY